MKSLGASDPRVAGRYRLIAELGRGGMGRVLLGGGSDGRLVASNRCTRISSRTAASPVNLHAVPRPQFRNQSCRGHGRADHGCRTAVPSQTVAETVRASHAPTAGSDSRISVSQGTTGPHFSCSCHPTG